MPRSDGNLVTTHHGVTGDLGTTGDPGAARDNHTTGDHDTMDQLADNEHQLTDNPINTNNDDTASSETVNTDKFYRCQRQRCLVGST